MNKHSYSYNYLLKYLNTRYKDFKFKMVNSKIYQIEHFLFKIHMFLNFVIPYYILFSSYFEFFSYI